MRVPAVLLTLQGPNKFFYTPSCRRQEVTPPVARTRRTRSEVSDDDEGDDDDDANSVGAGAAA